jgi:dinuclear metal center YbgI/SA1388 family protein
MTASIKIKDIIDLIDQSIAPFALAEKWDNVGLQVGDPEWDVNRVLVALDPTPEVLNEAIKQQTQLLITHHPLFIDPLKNISFNQSPGNIIALAAQHQIGIVALHTNLDSVDNGLNDLIANQLNLQNISLLGEPCEVSSLINIDQKHGLGRVGNLNQTHTLLELAHKIKELFNLKHLKIAGRKDLPVQMVAICSGSGASMIPQFLRSSAQVYISGDLKYHNALDVENRDRGLIDAGHFVTEHIVVNDLAKRLSQLCQARDWPLEITASCVEQDPFYYI